MRLGRWRLRSLCVIALSAASLASLGSSEARADGGVAASPAELVLDLGSTTLAIRKVTHGTFTQGSPPTEVGHEKDEGPPHQVTITRDFWIGRTPVTRGQFAKFVADTRYVTDAEKPGSGGSGWESKGGDGGKGALVQRREFNWRHPGFAQTDEHPVVLVSYGDATAFVAWASRKSGKRVRLPTEAEWELAARATTTTPWYGGAAAASDPTAFGWYKGNSGNGTHPVAQKEPNAFGLYDVSGNVHEWCRDVFAPYHAGALVDPETTTTSGAEPERRVLRGGSWLKSAKRGRSASRYRNTPGSRNADNGFRVVVTDDEVLAPSVGGSGGAGAAAGPGEGFVPSGPASAGRSSGAGLEGAHDGAARVAPSSSTSSSEGGSWGLLLASPLAAAGAVVAWMLLRKKRVAPSRRSSPAPIAAAVTDRPAAADASSSSDASSASDASSSSDG